METVPLHRVRGAGGFNSFLKQHNASRATTAHVEPAEQESSDETQIPVATDTQPPESDIRKIPYDIGRAVVSNLITAKFSPLIGGPANIRMHANPRVFYLGNNHIRPEIAESMSEDWGPSDMVEAVAAQLTTRGENEDKYLCGMAEPLGVAIGGLRVEHIGSSKTIRGRLVVDLAPHPSTYSHLSRAILERTFLTSMLGIDPSHTNQNQKVRTSIGTVSAQSPAELDAASKYVQSLQPQYIGQPITLEPVRPLPPVESSK